MTFGDNVDPVRTVDLGETVSIDERTVAITQSANRFLEGALGFRVKGSGRRVEQQDRRMLQKCKGVGTARPESWTPFSPAWFWQPSSKVSMEVQA